MSDSLADLHEQEHDEQAFANLVEELTQKMQGGERVDLDSCLRKHPQYGEQLRQLFPAMRVLADLGASVSDGDLPGTPTTSDTLPEIGTLGDFRVVRELGRGGMGVVYQAEQISLGRRVALKIFPFAAILDPRQLLRFKNEAQAAASLDHPNIVHVYSVGCERGVHYYAMQFIEGQSLAQVIEQGRGARGERGAKPPLPPGEGRGEGADRKSIRPVTQSPCHPVTQSPRHVGGRDRARAAGRHLDDRHHQHPRLLPHRRPARRPGRRGPRTCPPNGHCPSRHQARQPDGGTPLSLWERHPGGTRG